MEALTLKGFSKAYQTGTELVLARRWGGYFIYLAPLAIGLFCLQMVSVSVFAGLLFCFPFLYLGLSGMINNVIFTFDSKGLKITNKPIPWFLPPDKLISKSEIKQVFIKEIVRKQNGSATGRSYDVKIKLNNGNEVLIKSYEYVAGNSASSDASSLANLILKYIQ